ncbi:MAG: outer membrane lipoprotein chaperone LolA [Nitrospirae bacterium]|nr:outer membrane lipoprotein chaperone LolA [Nitrospirota bacterium]
MFIVHYSLFTVAHSATVDDVVNDLEKRFAEIKDVKGSFSQTSYLKDLEREEKYSGAFFIKKPSQMMWEYAAPRDEKVIINGTDTWIYKKSQKQAIKTRFSKETYSQVPIALLNSLENLRTDFDITLSEKDSLELKPKHQIGFIKEIILKTSSKKFPVKTLKVLDTYGNKITLELKDVETNTKPDDSLFIFTAPQGIEVYDMSQ